MTLRRWLRHLCLGDWQLRRRFSAIEQGRIEAAVVAAERHGGQIRFAVETALPWSALWAGLSARERAIDTFARLRVWDTEHNDGVLIYLLLADRDVEIVADRGVAGGAVPTAEWEACCAVMEAHFRNGDFGSGAVAGIEAVAAVLARHPAGPRAGNELPDAPALL
jgi:uncharacterized membrane protein